MRRHFVRLWTILMAFCCAVGAILVAQALSAKPEVIAALGGALAMLTPALIDAVTVERRRRTPGLKAVVDDIAPNLRVAQTGPVVGIQNWPTKKT